MTAVTLEYRCFAPPNFNVEVAGWAAISTRLALAVQTNAIAGIDPGGDLHGKRLLLANAALSVAGVRRIGNDFAAAFAARAGLLDGEYRLLDPNLALAPAGIAGLRR